MEEAVEYNAEKSVEEKIRIQKHIPFGPCGDWEIKQGPLMTRKEAIERIAKADWQATVCAKNGHAITEIPQEKWNEEWEKLRADYKKIYYAGAENALNALLEYK